MTREQAVRFMSATTIVPLPEATRSDPEPRLSAVRVAIAAGDHTVAVHRSLQTLLVVHPASGTSSYNWPRPVSSEQRWHLTATPASPLSSPAFRNDDVVYDEASDEARMLIRWGDDIIFAAEERFSASYLVSFSLLTKSFRTRALGFGGTVFAVFLAPNHGLGIVQDTGAIR